MKLSDAEWQIMNALWQKHPATAREIMDRLPQEPGWAYTTVKTMLTRLAGKKAVDESKEGNKSMYVPLVSQKSARTTALKTVFDKVLGGAVEPIMHFLVEEKKLSQKDRQKLIKMLEEMDQPGGEAQDESNQ